MRNIVKKWLSFVMAATLLIGLLQPQVSYAASANKYYIKVNRQQNCITVYEKDKNGKYTVPVRAMVCSTGANKATPLGKFPLGAKYRWHTLDGPVYGQYCSRITGHVLFHSVYYSTTDPSTLSYNAYNKLGSSVSHGCVRLCVEDAKWIYDNCPSGTIVEIYDSSDPGPLGKPTPIKIDPTSRYRGWDPTDPDPKNPWPKVKPKEEERKKEKKMVAMPTLTGAKDKTIERCSSKSKLTSGVSAADGKGKKLKVKVSGKYDLNKTGKYKITYSAADADGNQVKKTVTITVKDTKAPSLVLNESEVTITNEGDVFETISDMREYFKFFATATDSGELLDDEYINVALDALWDAWENSLYGTYKVTVYAKDLAGNKSKEKTMTVHFVNTKEASDQPNPDSSGTMADSDELPVSEEVSGSEESPGEPVDEP